jgi:hypothetical protein
MLWDTISLILGRNIQLKAEEIQDLGKVGAAGASH